MTKYTVPRVQGTYADILTALGIGRLLKALSAQSDVFIRLDADQDAFILETSQTVVLPEGVSLELYEYIKTDKDQEAPAQFYDYEKKKSARMQFFKWRETNKKTALTELPEGIEEPSPSYSLYSSLVDMLKPINTSGYATAYRELASERFSDHIQIALKAFSGEGLPQSKTEVELKKHLKGNKYNEVSVVQIFNPMSGKGMNSPKANSIGMGQEKSPLVLEAFKYTGWFRGAVAVTPKGSKDLKILVVEPADIEVQALQDVMDRFRKSFMSGGAIQLDILASLTLTQTLLTYHERQEDDWFNPVEKITGFQTAYFQNLGSAKGVTNISFIALPAWVKVENDAQRSEWVTILKEHHKIIRNLNESHSEERNLLERYRDFLSGQDVKAFLEFLSDYGPHALRLLDRGKPNKKPYWFTTKHLGRVLENMGRDNISTVIGNSGFQNIASAIRRSTRNALYARKLSNDRTYDVHYGLAQELKRSAVTKPKFMAALSEFVASYMTENLRAADREKRQARCYHR